MKFLQKVFDKKRRELKKKYGKQVIILVIKKKEGNTNEQVEVIVNKEVFPSLASGDCFTLSNRVYHEIKFYLKKVEDRRIFSEQLRSILSREKLYFGWER